ncbi:MAG: hypothetical protein ABSF26_22480 [Thermoguttaceae bacterium]
MPGMPGMPGISPMQNTPGMAAMPGMPQGEQPTSNLPLTGSFFAAAAAAGAVAGQPAPTPSAGPTPAHEAQSHHDSGELGLGFDPTAKAPLPFEMVEGGLPPGPVLPDKPRAETESPELSAPGPAQVPAPLPDITQAAVQPFHLRCPSGHVLRVTEDKLGTQVRCPICKKRFEARYENRVESERQRAKIQQRQDAKSGEVWLAWAILVAVAVIAGLLVLVFALG